jgi:hypothetical protein
MKTCTLSIIRGNTRNQSPLIGTISNVLGATVINPVVQLYLCDANQVVAWVRIQVTKCQPSQPRKYSHPAIVNRTAIAPPTSKRLLQNLYEYRRVPSSTWNIGVTRLGGNSSQVSAASASARCICANTGFAPKFGVTTARLTF